MEMIKEIIFNVKHIEEGKLQDSLDISTAKFGNIKIYGDFKDKEVFKLKVDNAIEVREYARKGLNIEG